MSPAIEEMKTSSAAIGLNAQKVASKRYSLKDQQGSPIEDWPSIVRRVVTHNRGDDSGPVSFMTVVNQVSDVVTQGGVRRGANMGIMRATHPDILRFIHAKNDQTTLVNFNISVNVTDAFLKAVDNNEWFQLSFEEQPWTKPIFDPVTRNAYAVYYDKRDYDIVTADTGLRP